MGGLAQRLEPMNDDFDPSDERVAQDVEIRIRSRRHLPCGCTFVVQGLHPIRPDWARLITILDPCLYHITSLRLVADDRDIPARLACGYVDSDNNIIDQELLAKTGNEAMAKLPTARWGTKPRTPRGR